MRRRRAGGALGRHAHHRVAVRTGQLGLREQLLVDQAQGLAVHAGAAPDDAAHALAQQGEHVLAGADGLQDARGGGDAADVLGAQDVLDLVEDVVDVPAELGLAPLADTAPHPARVEVDEVAEHAAQFGEGGDVLGHHVRARRSDVEPVALAGGEALLVEQSALPLDVAAPRGGVHDPLGRTGGPARLVDPVPHPGRAAARHELVGRYPAPVDRHVREQAQVREALDVGARVEGEALGAFDPVRAAGQRREVPLHGRADEVVDVGQLVKWGLEHGSEVIGHLGSVLSVLGGDRRPGVATRGGRRTVD